MWHVQPYAQDAHVKSGNQPTLVVHRSVNTYKQVMQSTRTLEHEAHHVGGQGGVGHIHVWRHYGNEVRHHDADAQRKQVHQPEQEKVSFELQTRDVGLE